MGGESHEGRQSAAAKRSWGRDVSRDRQGFFDFEALPQLVSFIAGHLPERCRVILLGGGRGYLGHLLDNGSRAFVNLDLAPSGRPFVPSAIADLETPLPVEPRRGGDLPTAAVAAFSIEYTDAARSLTHSAALLRSGEPLVWVSHHGDSFILADLRVGRELCRLVRRVAEEASRLPRQSWSRLADLATRESEALGIQATGRRSGELRFLLDRLGEVGDDASASSALARIEALQRRLEREAELSRILVDRPLRTPDELAALAGAAFRLTVGGPVVVDGRPLCVAGVFVRAPA
jgi:hypothetical protein